VLLDAGIWRWQLAAVSPATWRRVVWYTFANVCTNIPSHTSHIYVNGGVTFLWTGLIFYHTTLHHNPDNVTSNRYSTEGKPILVKQSVKVLFYPTPPDFLKSTTCWKVPRLCPFDLPTCTCRQVRNIGGMTLSGENGRARRKPCPSACPPYITSHGMTWDRTRTSMVTGRRPTAKAMARHLKTTINLNVSPQAQKTLHIGYKNQLMLCIG
jgi:hypothetical protein